MKCPRCVQTVTPGEESCSHCGYSMTVACGFYGEGSVVAEQLMDVESRLTAEERDGIRRAFEDFAAQFPQLFFMMYLGALPAPASPRQFAFWLLNHAAVQDIDVLLPNERGLLLVVDPQAGSAVLATGYFLETCISQADLDAVLRPAQRELGHADYPGAMRVITNGLASLLKKKAKGAAKHPGAFRPAAPMVAVFPPLVRTGEPVRGSGPEALTQLKTDESAGYEMPDAANEAAAKPAPKTVRRLKSAARRNPPRRS